MNSNIEATEAFCIQFCDYLLSLKTCDGTPLKSSRRKTFVIGFTNTFQALLSLSKDLLSHGYSYVLSFRISQDHIETLFSKIRRMGGFNNNPSSSHFKAALRKLLMNISVKGSGNANTLDCESTSSVFGFKWSKRRSAVHDMDDESVASEILPDLNIPGCFSSGELSDNILHYISGYVVRSMSSQTKCEICASALLDDEVDFMNSSSLLSTKNRGGLVSPSRSVFKIVQRAECIFRQYIITKKESLFTKPNVKGILIALFNRNAVEDQPTGFFFHDCPPEVGMLCHRAQLVRAILNKYLDIRLKYYSKLYNRKEIAKNQTSDRRRLNRLVIFKNQ